MLCKIKVGSCTWANKLLLLMIGIKGFVVVFFMGSFFRSNEDLTRSISKSIFVTNFPDSTSSKDLWKLCQAYGTVVDVYIPNRRSKLRKRFAFVRFIRVDNVDRLVSNLCTLWIGRMHLHANIVRFERRPVSVPKGSVSQNSKSHCDLAGKTFASAVTANITSNPPKPVLVLDDTCEVIRDLDNFVMGEVTQFSSINNLKVILSNEGFNNVNVTYLGGLWVMLEANSVKVKRNLLKHVGVASWFKSLSNAQADFAAKERIVWVDIEGIPLHVWSRNTFRKIGAKWGEMFELEDGNDDHFARKRICIKTSQVGIILESFKVIVKGKVFWVRAKELFVWSPSFKDIPEMELGSDDENLEDLAVNDANNFSNQQDDNNSDCEAVSDTYFGDNVEEPGNVESNAKEVSEDPFNIYDLLKKRNNTTTGSGSDSIPFPPGFTPDNNKAQDMTVKGYNSRILEDTDSPVEGVFF
nr:RNA-directed DNA polymerase, eukaryota, nucleotide-binding alpha-beta plait domain protein [Tanacetum cinerariifolium]